MFAGCRGSRTQWGRKGDGRPFFAGGGSVGAVAVGRRGRGRRGFFYQEKDGCNMFKGMMVGVDRPCARKQGYIGKEEERGRDDRSWSSSREREREREIVQRGMRQVLGSCGAVWRSLDWELGIGRRGSCETHLAGLWLWPWLLAFGVEGQGQVGT
ncbi:hypothetical protein LZ30DRAFT_707079 [Colletotrichum cereale]|nr:hypothetical protein LZ30DRAFT_707079 [Colletotrichum cereale]